MEPDNSQTQSAENSQPPATTPMPAPPRVKIHSSIEAATSPGEYIVFQVRKHIFGLAVMYLQVIIGFTIVSGLLLFLVPEMFADNADPVKIKSLLTLSIILFGALLALIMIIVTYIYRQNKMILTNRNVTQVIQNSLFSRQVSELALGNVEDVTADKRGIWALLFNFGEVRIETAGEQNNFHFAYCPNPNKYGQQLLDTRQQCIRENPPH